MLKALKFNLIITVAFIALLVPEIFSQENVSKDGEVRDRIVNTMNNVENLIHLGDLVDVDVVGSSEYDWRGSLTAEGYLNGLNFVDEPILAACQTEESVAAAVAKGYEKLLRNPQVVVKIVDRSRRPITLLYGAVKTPQRFQIYRSVKLNELLILSGGLTDKTNGEIQILRSPNLSCSVPNNSIKSSTEDGKQAKVLLIANQESATQYINVKISELIKGKAGSNPQILSGDVITVFESKPIFIVGGVLNPRQIEARSEINVSRAIAAAGGLVKNSDSKVSIFRVENKQTSVIEVDLDKIKSGENEDVLLKPYDIVEAGQKGKNRSKYAAATLNDDEKQRNPQNLPLRIID